MTFIDNIAQTIRSSDKVRRRVFVMRSRQALFCSEITKRVAVVLRCACFLRCPIEECGEYVNQL